MRVGIALILLQLSVVLGGVSGCGDSTKRDSGHAAGDPARHGDTTIPQGDPALAGSDNLSSDPATSGDHDGMVDSDLMTCPRPPGAADRERFVVISKPYAADGSKANAYEVYRLGTAGQLSATGKRFTMGRMITGDIVFTPDGELGFAVSSNAGEGTIGVFRLAADGTPQVLNEAFAGSFFASKVIMAPDGQHLYVVDGNWPNNGGGLYAVRITCDGALIDEGRIVSGKNPDDAAFSPAEPGRLLLASKEADGTVLGDDVAAYDTTTGATLVGAANLFDDDEQWVTDVAFTADGAYALVVDTADRGDGTAHRLAVVNMLPDGPVLAQVVSPLLFQYPTAVVASPFGNSLLVLTAEAGEDGLTTYNFDAGNTTAPVSLRAEVTYQYGRPQLPSSAVLLERGGLKGRVLIAEVSAIRQVQFMANGTVADVAKTSTGEGLENIVGALGVQP